MDRLTTRIDGIAYGKSGIKRLSKEYHRGIFECTALVERLAEYEDAEEQGLLVRLPCKFGSEVWYIDDGYGAYKKRVVKGVANNTLSFHNQKHTLDISWDKPIMGYFSYIRCPMPISDFGKTIFLTREEAEQKLKEMEGTQNV